MAPLTALDRSNNKRPYLQENNTSYLPEELIQDILVRLPLPSILKLKSICKNWCSIIQSRSFIEFHRAYHLHNDHIDELFFSRNHRGVAVVYTTTNEPYAISSLPISSILATGPINRQSTKLFHHLGELRRGLTTDRLSPPLEKIVINNQSGVLVLGPLSNGISCFVAHEYIGSKGSITIYDYCKVAFCNLATRQFNFIPYPFVREGVRQGLEAHHRVKFESNYNFGFCSIESPSGVAIDYKIVLIEDNFWSGRSRASVYSEQEGKWHSVKEAYDYHVSSPLLSDCSITQDPNWLPTQALLHGCCHWMVVKKYSFPLQHWILQFDMVKEVFGVIAGPPGDEYYPLYETERLRRSNVFVLDGCIAATVAITKGLIFEGIHVWRMMEYGVEASWRKVFSCQINLIDVSRVLGMCFCAETNRVERLFFEQDWKHLMSSDGSAVKRHRTFKHSWACWKPLGLSAFVETLEPVLRRTSLSKDDT